MFSSRLILALCLSLATTSSALQLVSTTPGHGDSGVATTTQLILQFDTPLDIEAGYIQDIGDTHIELPVQFLVAEPWDALVLESFQLSNDNTALQLDLGLQPDTDYTFAISAAVGADGSGLVGPELWCFSTAVAPGERQVSGSIEFSGVAGNTLVVLMDGPLGSEESRFLNGCLADMTGQYHMDPVRPGVYFPVAALDLDNNGVIEPGPGGDPLGFYDPDDDGLQDSIVVGQQDVDGILISLDTELTLRTAREAAGLAGPTAQAWNAQSELKSISGWEEPDELGAAQSWAFVYGVPGQEQLLVVVVSPFGVESFGMADIEGIADQPEVPAGFIDSDQVHELALANGGEEFLAEHGPLVQHLLTGGAQALVWPQDPQRRLWTYEFLVDNGGTQDLLLVMLDMLTGEVLNSTAVEPGPAVPKGLELAHNSPNPFNPDTILRFDLPAPGRIRLAVYDILGREVAVVLKGAYSAGEHQVRFDGSALSAGVYFYTLEYEGARLTRCMTLLK